MKGVEGDAVHVEGYVRRKRCGRGSRRESRRGSRSGGCNQGRK